MNLTYEVVENGYVILNNGKPWIRQLNHIPYPGETLEESAQNHIDAIIADHERANDPTLDEELEELKAANAQLGQELVDFKLDYLSVPCQYHQDYASWVDGQLKEDDENGTL